MTSQPKFAFGSTAVHLNFWQPSPWAKVFIGLFVWYRLDPQQLESAAVISHCCSEAQGSCYGLSQLRIWPTEGERSHRKGSSFTEEPSSLPSGFAARGADTLTEGKEGKTPLSPYLDVQPCTKAGWDVNPCMGSFPTWKHWSLPWILLCIFLHINQLHHHNSNSFTGTSES